ncbi:hypothetical protein ROTO_16040 [Roseovarius tolerans]|uniref:DUF4268 domain-containing protein n=1 Tax=Roseovarius tolerans TaxID=74031 RepID=A0A0L6CVT8_9RHOB|nr:DUF4268 domain-containing protein [Roseovarius tolerans]KNX41879.1 hypothetical protein ROTO_16040 [Roseovarius tolerans]
MSELGRLNRVELRDIWQSEAQDFTPWLAREDNLALLGETLGIDLELEAVEQNVGPFRADILCKNTLSDRWVLVENQLERTDHTHLGQLMTYAAGLDAVTIVWIAARVADEHRAAMDWLNELTDTEVRFFALEVELWRIGDSPAAPKFNVVSKPNDWSRNTAAAKRTVEDTLTPTRALQQRYWNGVQALLAQNGGPMRPVSAPAQSWLSHGIGKTGVGLNMAMNTRENWVRVEIYLAGKWAKQDFAVLEARKPELDTAFGSALEWQGLPEKQDARICHLLKADIANEADWPRQHEWLVRNAVRMREVFHPHVTRLDRRDVREDD